MTFTRFTLDYLNQWPTVLAAAPFVFIGAGWAGRSLALYILRMGKKEDFSFLVICFVALSYLLARNP